MWLFWFLLFLAYSGVSWYSLVQSVEPQVSCNPTSRSKRSQKIPTKIPCYRPLVTTGDRLRLELWVNNATNPTSGKNDWILIPTCQLEVRLPETGKLPTLITANGTDCKLPLPDSARYRSPRKDLVRPLQAEFVVWKIHQPQDADDDDDPSNENQDLASNATDTSILVQRIPLELTRILERRPSGFWSTGTNSGPHRKLLDDSSAAPNPVNQKGITEPTWIPFLKYFRAAIRIRFVAEDRDFGGGAGAYGRRGIVQRKDGISHSIYNHTRYMPLFYVDDLSLTRSSQVELAPPEDNKPPINLQIKISSLPPILDSINRQTHDAFAMFEEVLPMGGDEMDEIRYMLSDERLYRFFWTQIISYIHITFDYLAFRDEIRFYRGKKNRTGISTSSAIIRLLCSVIIFLYLLDGGGTSWVVLGSLASSCSVDGWKVWKLLEPRFLTKFPFVAIRELQAGKEQETALYDRTATINLALVLYPLVIGWALYALQEYEYKSWYSWFISNLANVVYTFGFISLCPQLYVNYKLKSVAHLPWKVFMYKIFNTFVDDAFAWIIEMPWKHKIMTLRDDVIFFFFLIQVYLYKVDKSRTNEFGYAYDDDNDGPNNAGNKKAIQMTATESEPATCATESKATPSGEDPSTDISVAAGKEKFA